MKAACTTPAGVLDIAPPHRAACASAPASRRHRPRAASTRSTARRGRSSGPVQKAQFEADLHASTAKWKIVLSEDAIQQFYALPYDRWEGYGAERLEILNHIRNNDLERRVPHHRPPRQHLQRRVRRQDHRPRPRSRTRRSAVRSPRTPTSRRSSTPAWAPSYPGAARRPRAPGRRLPVARRVLVPARRDHATRPGR